MMGSQAQEIKNYLLDLKIIKGNDFKDYNIKKEKNKDSSQINKLEFTMMNDKPLQSVKKYHSICRSYFIVKDKDVPN